MVSCSEAYWRLLQCIRQHGIIVAWLLIVSFVFWSTYYSYMTDPRYYYLREMVGCGLFISRATASVVNVSCFMVLIPMSRSFTTYIRIFGSKISAKCVQHWIDASRTFHVICAFTILFAGCLHSVAHVINALNFSKFYNLMYKDVNIANFQGEDPLQTVIGTVPGITGVLMIMILLILSAAAVQYVRTLNYDLFWFSHHLFLLFFILLLCHPMSGLLKQQVNIQTHPPGCQINISIIRNTEAENLICNEPPIFISEMLMTWKWVAAGLIVYIVDLSFRMFRRQSNVQLLGIQVYKCHVLCLKLLKDDFTAKPGQYVYLQCPRISVLEWHPFSISECPSVSSPAFKIHLRVSGDWSGALKNYLIDESKAEIESLKMHDTDLDFSSTPLNQRILIDGPYSSCFEDVLQYSVSICIAGGIGFTPFASVLNYLRIDIQSLNKIKRIHLFWICREVEIFTCFSDLLSNIFEIVWNLNCPDKLEFCLYLTKAQSWDIIEDFFYFDTISSGIPVECFPLLWSVYLPRPASIYAFLMHKDVLQGTFPFLKPRICFGRPQWNILFKHWTSLYKKTNVGLFCCGPQNLTHSIEKLSQKWNVNGCHFSYHHEAFS